jgi:electron transport complex protein RnfA
MSLFIASILSDNIILTRFLGICPFLGTSNKEKNAIRMGIAVTLVLLICTVITYFVNKYILIPTDTTYLQTLTFILIIASLVQIMELFSKKFFKSFYKSLGIYLPLIATNCAVLGVILINTRSSYTLLESIVHSLGSSIGFVLILYIFSHVRECIKTRPVLKSFQGIPIALITAGIMALIFGRFIA